MPKIERLVVVCKRPPPIVMSTIFLSAVSKYREKRRVGKLRRPKAVMGKKRKTGTNSFEEIISLEPDLSSGQDASNVVSTRKDGTLCINSSEPTSPDNFASSSDLNSGPEEEER